MSVIPFPAERAAHPPVVVLEDELVHLRKIAARANNVDALKEFLGTRRARSPTRLALDLRDFLMAE